MDIFTERVSARWEQSLVPYEILGTIAIAGGPATVWRNESIAKLAETQVDQACRIFLDNGFVRVAVVVIVTVPAHGRGRGSYGCGRGK